MAMFPSPELKLNPYPMYAMMRENAPILYYPENDVWLVFNYDLVKTVLSDSATFSSEFRRAFAGRDGVPPAAATNPEAQRFADAMISTDPPRHTQLRNLVTRAFTPRAVASLEPRIRELAHGLIDQVIAAGRMDLVEEFTAPMPVMVIAEMLGIPTEDRLQFKVWSDHVVASSDSFITGEQDPTGERARSGQEMADYLLQIIAQRRAAPKDDLISNLLAADVDGQMLTDAEVLSFCWLLLVAGNETTTNLMSNAILTFLDHPDKLAEVRANPELLPAAIEEVLRYRSPVQAMFRVAARDVKLAGQTIKEGQRVVAFIGSANRDEARFVEADQFDPHRDANPHIAFGHGIHFCLGAPLARLEARIGLGALLERLHEIRREDDDPLVPVQGFIVHGVAHLPILFTPGQRRS